MSYQDAITKWNIQVHHWLKYYVMMRWMDRSKARGKPQLIPTIVTFLASGAWHGVVTA